MDAARFRKLAEKVRAKAARLGQSPHKERLLKIAAHFDARAEHAESANGQTAASD